MSTPSKYRSGFTCRAMRMYASFSSSESMLAHLESCASCREFFRAGDELETTLRGEAAQQEAAAPDALERGIMHAVRTSEPSAVPPRSFFPILAGAAALVAAVATVFISRPGTMDTVADNSHGDMAAVVEAAGTVSDRFWTEVVPSVESLVEDNPLPAEISLVYADAKRALDFLALNFLPSTAVAAAVPSASSREGG